MFFYHLPDSLFDEHVFSLDVDEKVLYMTGEVVKRGGCLSL